MNCEILMSIKQITQKSDLRVQKGRYLKKILLIKSPNSLVLFYGVSVSITVATGLPVKASK